MSDQPTTCAQCGSSDIRLSADRGQWVCAGCDRSWSVDVTGSDTKPGLRQKLFISYGRKDAEQLAERIDSDLSLLGFEVWRDKRQIRSGFDWDREIESGLRSSQLVVALLSPQAVRVAADANNSDHTDSVCLDEIAFARFACKLPIVPVLAFPCEPPFVIFRLDYIDLCAWRDSNDQYQRGFLRLFDAIRSALRGEPPRYRKWDTRLQPFDFASFLFDRRRDFCGREWLFDEIENWRADVSRYRALLDHRRPWYRQVGHRRAARAPEPKRACVGLPLLPGRHPRNASPWPVRPRNRRDDRQSTRWLRRSIRRP